MEVLESRTGHCGFSRRFHQGLSVVIDGFRRIFQFLRNLEALMWMLESLQMLQVVLE